MKKTKRNTKIQVILIVVALILGSIFVINKIASGKTYASVVSAVCPAGNSNCSGGTSVDVVTQAATCIATGKKNTVCSGCNMIIEKDVTLAKNPNNHANIKYKSDSNGHHDVTCEACKSAIAGAAPCNYGSPSQTPATCETPGSITKTCQQCGYTMNTVLPATGHTNPGWVEVASTCTKKGYRYYYCSMCFQEIREELELADHKYTVVNNENGTHTVKCSVCGEEKETKSCTNFTTTTSPATCLAEGYNRSVCRVCGYTKTTTLPALGHEYGQDGKCTRCGVAKPTTPGGGDPNPDPGDGGDPNPNPGDGEDTKAELSGITIYKVNDKDMTNVKINTKASELIKTIQDANEGAIVTIFNSNNEVVSEDETLATGMRIEVTIGDTKYDITIVVKGDINGDGKAELIDIIKMNKHRLNKSQLEGAYLQAADVNGDGKVNLFDIVKLNKFRLNKITEL